MSGFHQGRIRTCKALALFGLVLTLSPGSVGTADATGSAFIPGCRAPTSQYSYMNVRTVTNPALPGPEVAFNQSTGGSDLFLGATNSGSGGGAYVFGGIFPQTPGVWEPEGLISNPYTRFCLGAGEYNNPTVGYSGDLAWD